MVASGGIEPPTQGFSVLCSTDWAMKPIKMAVSTGLEPAIFCVTGRRVNQLHHETNYKNGCGKRIWTSDLWVMSPTSYRTALSRDIINGGGKGIRTPAPLAWPPGFQDRSLQPTWVFLQFIIFSRRQIDYNIVFFDMSTKFTYFSYYMHQNCKYADFTDYYK